MISGTLRGRLRESLPAYAFLAPWLVGLVGLTLVPMVLSLYYSFTDYSLLSPPVWEGLANYERMFSDDRFQHSLVVTFTYVLLSVPLELVFALAVAVVLNQGLRAVSFYRAVYYVPSLLGGSVAVAILWRQIFGADGLVNQVLGLVGLDGPGWISSPDTSLFTLVLLRVWQFGAPMVIFLAGLRQIPADVLEAAEVDGAGRLRRFFHITLPLLSPIVFFNLVLQIIGAFQAFTPAFIISGGSGGPSDSTLFYTLYLYQKAFGSFEMGYAAAMAWVLLLIIAGFTAANFAMSRRWVFYADDRESR
ncbi:carbohydrate ABC transporter permease [Kribbella italica]|uniref:Multiple sugar transport system permease protein n=1 Tax=Kribbella italica TaxID=1540520 RepID=A0A7W9J2C4_9ACTN|nr:sugar ABC transporter permease [Kribbella italica]MBB5833757.1 multiple sugar transport system permease protein [Kribbella italica]